MFSRFLAVFLAFFLTSTAAQARTWNITIPTWVSELASTHSADDETACVALAVYYESRGETIRGQRAVASVVMNRARSGRFPESACGVLFQRSQFSFIKGHALTPAGGSWDTAMQIAREFVARADTEVPYLFFSSERRLRGYRIGGHVFR